jgi:SAM-dependent methyltransferase
LKRVDSTERATDWDSYYCAVPFTARLTRKYTNGVLLRFIRAVARSNGSALRVVELGGANSCFLDTILAAVAPRSYDIVDTNAFGLSLLERRIGRSGPVHLHQQSVFDMKVEAEADLVLSVGLVEHFDPPRTRSAVLAHFDILRPGGTAIITFPTPTWLYRATRRLIEAMGMWKFHDERPLIPAEVITTISQTADIIATKTLWPLLLTQYLVVAVKR